MVTEELKPTVYNKDFYSVTTNCEQTKKKTKN